MTISELRTIEDLEVGDQITTEYCLNGQGQGLTYELKTKLSVGYTDNKGTLIIGNNSYVWQAIGLTYLTPEMFYTTDEDGTTNVGMIEGLPTPNPLAEAGIPKYTRQDYLDARTNIEAISATMDAAEDMNINAVILTKKGEFAITYFTNVNIHARNGVKFNLNTNKLKVIYDSDNYSPYEDIGLPTWEAKQGYTPQKTIVNISGKNTEVFNGELEGIASERTYLNTDGVKGEEWQEWTFCLAFNYYDLSGAYAAKYCHAHHLNMHHGEGDNVRLGYSEFNMPSLSVVNLSNDLTWEVGGLDNSGNDVVSTTDLRSIGIYDLGITEEQAYSEDVLFKLRTSTGDGNIMTLLSNKTIELIFFDKNDVSLGKKYLRVHDVWKFPKEARGIKIVVRDDTDVDKDFAAQLKISTEIAMFNKLSYNDIGFGHRGGVFLGGNYAIIEHNYLFHNGGLGGQVEYDYAWVKEYPDPTNYAISMEDEVGAGATITNNLIEASFHGILLEGLDYIVNDNTFLDIRYALLDFKAINLEFRGNKAFNVTYNASGGLTLHQGQESGVINIVGNNMPQTILRPHNTNSEIFLSGNKWLRTPDIYYFDSPNIHDDGSNVSVEFSHIKGGTSTSDTGEKYIISEANSKMNPYIKYVGCFQVSPMDNGVYFDNDFITWKKYTDLGLYSSLRRRMSDFSTKFTFIRGKSIDTYLSQYRANNVDVDNVYTNIFKSKEFEFNSLDYLLETLSQTITASQVVVFEECKFIFNEPITYTILSQIGSVDSLDLRFINCEFESNDIAINLVLKSAGYAKINYTLSNCTFSDNITVIDIADFNIGTIIDLSNAETLMLNMSAAESGEAYTFVNETVGGKARSFINTVNIPVITGGTLRTKGDAWVTATDMYMYVEYNGVDVEYWFELK